MSVRSILSVAACGLFSVLAHAQNAAPPAAPKPATEAAKPAREPGLYATITTSMGTIVAKLFEEESPKTVKNFADLAMGRKEWPDPKTKTRVRRPLFNGLIFHRVIPGFMIQTGDPEGTGFGGTDRIPAEFHPSLTFDRPGRLGMANSGGDPSTGSSQFFITEVPTPHLNGLHPIFGQVVEGQDIVTKIAHAPSSGDRPTTPIKMLKVSVARVGPAPAGAAPAKPAVAKPKTGVAKPKPTTAKPKPAASKPAAAKPKPVTEPAK